MSVTYDACVIGSGAAGGVMAKGALRGRRQVILLEAVKKSPHPIPLALRPYDMEFRGFRGEKQEPFLSAGSERLHTFRDSGQRRRGRPQSAFLAVDVALERGVLRYAAADFRDVRSAESRTTGRSVTTNRRLLRTRRADHRRLRQRRRARYSSRRQTLSAALPFAAARRS